MSSNRSAEELASTDRSGTPLNNYISIWLDMLNAGHKLVISGLAREVAPGGDTLAAYRSWYAEQMEEHDRVVERMLRRMQRSRSTHAC